MASISPENRFLALLPAAARKLATRREDLAGELTSAHAEGRAAWPSLTVSLEEFAEYLATRIDHKTLADDRALCPHASDLYLCCGCTRGDENAVALFDEHFLGYVDRAIRRMTSSDDDMAELKQVLRVRLLVGNDDNDPKIASYRGSSALSSWLRVAAVRQAIALLRQRKRHVELDDDELAMPELHDPAMAQLRQRYKDDFKAAFRAAFATLDERDRTILRQNIVEGIEVEKIAALHDVHRVTASRWLAKIRRTLLERTRRELTQRRSIDANEVDSVMRLIQSGLVTSIHNMLRSDEPAGPE